MLKKIVKKAANLLGLRISSTSYSDHSIDPIAELQFLSKQIPEPIIFDVGAHTGEVAVEFTRLFPSAKVYAFEPFEDSFDELKKNTASEPRISVFNFGFSDVEGRLSFNSNKSEVTNSLLETDKRSSAVWGKGLLETERKIEAEFRTLDAFTQAMEIQSIDVLKLDVQGAEYLVMKGAEGLCSEGRINLILTEFITQPSYKNQKRYDAALSEFYNRGFDLHNLFNLSLTKDGKLRQMDAIFLRKDRIVES